MPAEAVLVIALWAVVDIARWIALGRTDKERRKRDRLRDRIGLQKMRTWLLVVALVFMAGFTALLLGARSLELEEGGADARFASILTMFITMSIVLTVVFIRALAIRLWRLRTHRDERMPTKA